MIAHISESSHLPNLHYLITFEYMQKKEKYILNTVSWISDILIYLTISNIIGVTNDEPFSCVLKFEITNKHLALYVRRLMSLYFI